MPRVPDDLTDARAKKITLEILKERSGNIDTKTLKQWYDFICEVINERPVRKA